MIVSFLLLHGFHTHQTFSFLSHSSDFSVPLPFLVSARQQGLPSFFRSFSARQGISSVIVLTFWTVGFSDSKEIYTCVKLVVVNMLFGD